ncbi:MAG: hypothetical protein RR500_00890 [Bacilli bacterium]
MSKSDIVSSKEGEKKKKLILIIIPLLLVLLIGGAAWWLNRPSQDFFFDKEARDGMISAKSKEDVQKVLDTIVDKGMYNASINPNPVFKDGEAEGDLWIENIKANHYYATVTITLDDTNETVFKSGGIKPDQNIEKAKLSKNLKKGNYPATANFEITDPDSLKTIGSVNIKINITIQN